MPHKSKSNENTTSRNRVTIDEFDATTLIGLPTVVIGAAYEETDEDGEQVVTVPQLKTLAAAAAVSRCLMPVRLRGPELRAMRKIMGLTLVAMAERLDGTANTTVSKWESEAQQIGGYAEKVFRLQVCEALYREASGVAYDGSMIARLRVLDPWMADPNFALPPMRFHLVKMKEQSGAVIDVYNNLPMAA